MFVKAWTHPHDEKRKKFKRAQERARKDVERAFGALKKRFHIVAKPCLFFSVDKMKEVMKTCVILHNMIIEDEGRAICTYDEDDEVVPETQAQPDDDEYADLRLAIRNHHRHHALRNDLSDHVFGIGHIDLNADVVTEDVLDFADENEEF